MGVISFEEGKRKYSDLIDLAYAALPPMEDIKLNKCSVPVLYTYGFYITITFCKTVVGWVLMEIYEPDWEKNL